MAWTASGSDPIWQRASPTTPDMALDLIATELQTLRNLLVERRIGEFQDRMRHRNADMARAYPMAGSVTKRAAADSAMLDGILPPAPLVCAPIDRNRLRLRPFAGGRVIACSADDGSPPLRCRGADGDPIFVSTTFAMVDGKMVVIR